MKSKHKCKIFYSLIGDQFSIQDIVENKKGVIASSDVILEVLYIDALDEIHLDIQNPDEIGKTVLAINHDIPTLDFYTSKTYCRFIKENGTQLFVGSHSIFEINMFRNSKKIDQLTIKFNNNDLLDPPSWK